MRKNILRLAITTALTLTMLTACNKGTTTVPDTEVMERTNVAETSGENLISTEATESTKNVTETTSVATTASNHKDNTTEATTPSKTVEAETESTLAQSASTTQAQTEKQTRAQSEKATENTTEVQTTTQEPAKNQTEKPSKQQTTTNQETQEQQTTQKPTEPQTTKEEHKHSYSSSVTRNATCIESGTITHTCSCGDSYTEDIPATGHTFGSYSYNNDATEYADGTETATCSVCGAKDTRTASGTKLVHNHSYNSTVTKNPACTEEGVTTYTCSCGHSYTESIPATGHSFGEYVYNNDATSESDGTKTAVCLVCGVTDTVAAEGTKITLPSWYDEHPDIQLNVATGGMRDGSLEAYYVGGQFSWTDAANGCWDFGYSADIEYVGEYKEGWVKHGYLTKN